MEFRNPRQFMSAQEMKAIALGYKVEGKLPQMLSSDCK